MLSKLGISRDQLIDSNGKLKSMSEVMKVINDHTKDIHDVDERNNIFHALFGTTGMQAGIILAQNNDELGKLTDKVKGAADGQGYVASLAEKNMQSTKAQLSQLKSVGQEITMTFGAAMLPAINKAAKAMQKGFDSKGGQKFLKETADLLGKLATNLVDMAVWMGSHKTEVEIFAGILGSMFAVKKVGDFVGALKRVNAELKLSSLIIKPKIDSKDAKRELGILSKMVVGLGKGLWFTAKIAGKAALKTLEYIGDAVIAVGKGLAWTAKLAWSGVKTTLGLIGKAGKATGKAFAYTAKLAWSGVKAAGNAMITFLKSPDKYIKYTAKLFWSGVKRTIGLISSAAKGVGKAFVWTAKLAYNGVKTALSTIPKLIKGIPGMLKWTAQIAVNGAKNQLNY